MVSQDLAFSIGENFHHHLLTSIMEELRHQLKLKNISELTTTNKGQKLLKEFPRYVNCLYLDSVSQ